MCCNSQLELPNIEPMDNERLAVTANHKGHYSAGNAGTAGTTNTDIEWQVPRPLIEDTLPKALKLRDEMLPKSIRRYVLEKSFSVDNMPPDFLAVALIVMAGAMIGSNVEIEPKKNDSWRVACVIWSLLVGKASARKTPALSSAISFVDKVKTDVIAPKNKRNEAIHKVKVKRTEAARIELEKQLEDASEHGDDKIIAEIADKLSLLPDLSTPDQKEVYINDSTIEALTICAQSSPSGITVIRDEISGLLSAFSQSGRTHERALYLEGFNGKRNPYIVRRVGRDPLTLPQLFINVLGGIQPDMLAPHIQSALNGKSNDGFLERCLQMSVLPEISERRVTDFKVSEQAEFAVLHCFSKLADLDQPANPIRLKFSPKAQAKWRKWSEEAMNDEKESPAHLESYHVKRIEHCAKLAMIFHLFDEAEKTAPHEQFQPSEVVELTSLSRAMVWMRYLRSHAYRIVASTQDKVAVDSPAQVLLSRLSKFQGQFTRHSLSQKGWKSLTTAKQREEAVNTLIAHGYLKESMITTKQSSKPVLGLLIHPDYA
ncbi:DUF3987 domain-containing protein [Vibrio tubiashii]|uniref:DUF3987 domain-containing protein n=2 Tax=Vibrio tubiashii TaxID=29498 RepID=A0AAE5GPD7_9VIBR|nr:DUF3987 domain-containing protein [Vibrio tubiashii]